jgi:DNA-binding SARP family transcriptional activator
MSRDLPRVGVLTAPAAREHCSREAVRSCRSAVGTGGGTMRINMLGETEVVGDQGALSLRGFGGAKPRQILEILVLHRQQPLAKEQLVEMLWESNAPTDPIAALVSYVSVLRSKIEPGVARADSVIVTGNGNYSLDRSRVSVDLDEFDGLVHASASQPPAAARSLLLSALGLARGPLLAHEPYVGWAAQARVWYQTRVVAVTLQAAELGLQLGDVESATRLAERAGQLDPLSEGACRLVMRSYWAAGGTSDALRAYDTLRRALRDEMGVAPSESTKSLFTAILSTDNGVDGPDSRQELSVLVEAVVELYRRSHGALLAQRTIDPHQPTQLLPRQVRRAISAEAPERLLTELLALSRLPSAGLAAAQ